MADDDQPRLSTSERRRQLALDHVKAARRRIKSASRPEPELDHGEAGPPPPRIPSDPPVEVASSEPEETADEDDEDAEISTLMSSVDALTVKYQMEMSAHRHTTDELIQQQQAHIASLQRLVEELSAKLDHKHTA